MTRARTFRLDADAIARVPASRVLAISLEAMGSIVTLPESAPENGAADKIAIVAIEGPLAQRAQADLCGYVDGYDAIEARFGAALASPEIGAVVLRVDSPGGDASGVSESTRRMRAAADASGKPVFAFVDEWAASAAYWLASGVANAGVFLPDMGAVGSIGVFSLHVDKSRALENDGFKVAIIRDPAGKGRGHPFEPLSDEARAEIQSHVSATTDRFVSDVARARGVKPEAIRDLNARMLRGADAVSFGLADGVDSLEGVIARARKAIEMKEVLAKASALVKAPEGATAEQVLRSLDAAAPLLDLGRAALAMTGESDATKAGETLAAWKRGADAHATAQADEAAQAERDALEAAKREAAERVEIVKGMVARGALTPAKAYVDGDTAKVAEPFASMAIAMLRAVAGSIEVSPIVASTAKATAADSPIGLSQEEIEYCKANGFDPTKWAASKAAVTGRKAHGSDQ